MAGPIQLAICESVALVEGGDGVRFDVLLADGPATAFVVRFDGLVRGYVNRCGHLPTELDWSPGKFFEGSGLYLMCATHGAIYEPETGHCAGGPCRGQGLAPVSVFESGGTVFWIPDTRVRAAAEGISGHR
jgi:nitrite reductase/ring-hydroxylating ferredoxin subunit